MTEPSRDHLGAVLGHSRGGVRGNGACGWTGPDDLGDMRAGVQRDGGNNLVEGE